MGPGVLELSNLAAGKFLGLGNVTVWAVCDMSCPFFHLACTVASPVSQLRRDQAVWKGVGPSISPSHTAPQDPTLPPSPRAGFWAPGVCSSPWHTYLHLCRGDCLCP